MPPGPSCVTHGYDSACQTALDLALNVELGLFQILNRVAFQVSAPDQV